MSERPQRRGIVYTFYSYKGGAGRTMALANVAALLAQWGHSVLVIDWDLEAPGLDRFFSTGEPDQSLRASTPGLIEIIESYASGNKIDWHRCVSQRYGVSIISSGLDDGNYAHRVQNIDFGRLFADCDLGSYIETLRDQWTSEFEFVLIDSRTGLTDIGGICTVHLPDVLVAFFTANGSSTQGVLEIIKRTRAARSKLPVDRIPLAVVPVPARDESRTEYQQATIWKNRFSGMFNELYRDWLPNAILSAEAVDTLRIPYVPFWSFGEQLPVLLEGAKDASSISYAYELLARLLANRLDWYKAVDAKSLPPIPTVRIEVPRAAWLEKQRKTAEAGLHDRKRNGFMEVFHYCVDSVIDKGSSDLLAVASQAAIHTFGWPIGVVLRNVPDRRPHPVADGIYSEILSIDGAYDYWALSRAGDFYSLMSLFEDERADGKVFFDTRVVRVTETIMHAIGLYRGLGTVSSALIRLTVRHGGLRGRKLTVASPNRAPFIFEAASVEDSFTSPTVEFHLGVTDDEITRLVEQICAPLFELFNFQKFGSDIYKEIVTQFMQGRVV